MLYHRIIKAATSGGENEGGEHWEEADTHGGGAGWGTRQRGAPARFAPFGYSLRERIVQEPRVNLCCLKKQSPIRNGKD